MARRDKRIAAMQRNPTNVRPHELDTVLIAAGFSIQRQTGSHKIYTYGPYMLPVPQHKPFLKPTYVRQALELLDKLEGEDT